MGAPLKCLTVAAVLLAAVPSVASASGPGTVDRSFGADGAVELPLDPAVSMARMVAGPAGELDVIAPAEQAVTVMRFTPDGEPDLGFGVDGAATVPLAADVDPRNAIVAVHPDGGLVIAAMAGTALEDPAVAVVRLDRAGREIWRALDRMPLQLGSVGALLVLPDGAILVAGGLRDPVSLSVYAFVARLQAQDGAPDARFGADGSGVVLVPPPESECGLGFMRAQDLVRRADGSIVLAGTADGACGIGGPGDEPFLAAFTEAGSRIASFGAGELGLDGLEHLIARRDGRFVGVGEVGPEFPALAFYSTAGTLERPAVQVFRRRPQPTSPVLAPAAGGRVVVVSRDDDRVIRVLRDGRRDRRFGHAGVATTGTVAVARPAVQPDGKLVVLGMAEGRRVTLTRLFSGTAMTRVRIGRSARLGRRAVRVELRCVRAADLPDCSGTVRARATRNRVTYRVRAGRSTVIRLPLDRRTRRRVRRDASIRVVATNAEALTVERRVRLRAGAQR